MAENLTQWPKDTKIKKGEDGKREIIFSRPTNMAAWNKTQAKKKNNKEQPLSFLPRHSSDMAVDYKRKKEIMQRRNYKNIVPEKKVHTRQEQIRRKRKTEWKFKERQNNH